MVRKVLKDPNKRNMYTDEEILYMEMQMKHMKIQREIRKEQRKRERGFGYGGSKTD